MTIEFVVYVAGAFLVFLGLAWKAYRGIERRLSEIQAQLGELHSGVAHLSMLGLKSKAMPSKPESNIGRKAYRVIDQRLSEIQAQLGELHSGLTHLCMLALRSEAAPSKLKSNIGSIAFRDGNAAHKADELVALRSPELEAELDKVDDLCAKLASSPCRSSTLAFGPKALPMELST